MKLLMPNGLFLGSLMRVRAEAAKSSLDAKGLRFPGYPEVLRDLLVYVRYVDWCEIKAILRGQRFIWLDSHLDGTKTSPELLLRRR